MKWSYEDYPITTNPHGVGWEARIMGIGDGPRFYAPSEIDAALGLIAVLSESNWGRRAFSAGGFE